MKGCLLCSLSVFGAVKKVYHNRLMMKSMSIAIYSRQRKSQVLQYLASSPEDGLATRRFECPLGYLSKQYLAFTRYFAIQLLYLPPFNPRGTTDEKPTAIPEH
jgi:hypothetical protein